MESGMTLIAANGSTSLPVRKSIMESDLNSLAFSHCHRVVALEVVGVLVTLVVARRAELSATSCQTDVTGW